MASPNIPAAPIDPPVAKQRKCGGCGQTGHNRRTCPVVPFAAAPPAPAALVGGPNAVTEVGSPPPILVTAVQNASSIDWDKVLYVVFDLETTGRSRQRDEIIEVAALILNHFGIPIEDAVFSQFVKPTTPIPPFITELTSITNDHVSTAERFPAVGDAFIRFMQQHADEHQGHIDHIILVGHNGKVFDIPFLVQQLSVHGMAERFFRDGRFGLGIDTLRVARKGIQDDKSGNGVPTAYNLPTLFQFVTGSLPPTWHRAMADVQATTTIFRFPLFWETRKECVFRFFGRDEEEQVQDNNDSSDDNSSQSTGQSSDEEDSDDEDVPLGDRWEQGSDFQPAVPLPMERFQEHFTSSGRSRRQRTGLQCSPIDVNTPIRAWREVFKNTLLEKIVRYTNEYGRVHAKRWSDISRKDLESFLAVLFISGIQKRKDKPSNWFSENRILENPVMKKVMSGRRFFTILRYLHCCPVENQDRTAEDYDPSYKVAEVRDYLEDRYRRLFVPGQQLSLDETLIRAFGRIKFKVRIVTKAARYGIKIYVITDAATAFVLRVLIYTGKTTYYADSEAQAEKKTVQVVNRLVEPFVGSHRTIYVDRFYTSMDLLKSLAEKNLYITGTMLANRIPQGIRVAKASRTFKGMKRGEALKCKLRFTTVSGKASEAGLVCWRDRNMVYCLSNDSNNFEFDECSRRGEGGIIRIPRPISIANYNKYMGGVDLADMRRLHCNSTIMGQNRWWLKLFFYLLDVGTSNALVLYNESMKMRLETAQYTPINIVQFKMQLVEDLVGKSINDLFESGGTERGGGEHHTPIHIVGGVRPRCAYCSMLSRFRRTRYQCAGCGVPLCSIGNGRVEDDCFTAAHETEDRRQMVCKRYQEVQKRYKKQK
jgi:DNA polymerase III epsilon subunit-like protein